MPTCQYCKKSLDDGDNDGTVHNACRDWRLNREKNTLCIACGNPTTAGDRLKCFSCESTGAEFQGYSGF